MGEWRCRNADAHPPSAAVWTALARGPGAAGPVGEWRCRNSVAIALSDGGDTAMRVLGQEALAFSRARPGSGAAFLSELWRRTERASEGVCELTFFYGCTCCGRAAPVHSRRGRPREGEGCRGGASSSCVRVCRSEHAPREIKGRFPPAHARHLLPRATARSHGAWGASPPLNEDDHRLLYRSAAWIQQSFEKARAPRAGNWCEGMIRPRAL